MLVVVEEGMCIFKYGVITKEIDKEGKDKKPQNMLHCFAFISLYLVSLDNVKRQQLDFINTSC